MNDTAARLVMIGMFAIATAIVIGQGVFTVVATSEGRAGPSAIVVNKLTGDVRLCHLQGCKDLADQTNPFLDPTG